MRDDVIDEEERIAEERAFDKTRLTEEGLQQPIRELPTLHPAITCEPNATVRQAIVTMQQARIGCVLVVDQGRLVGIFTERDVLTKIAARDVDIDQVRVGELMTADPECLDLDNELAYALNQMSIGGYRHIPLLDDQGQPINVVSMRDIVNYLVAVFYRDVLNLPPSPPHGIPQAREGA
jgi:CBS domain-containing protein